MHSDTALLWPRFSVAPMMDWTDRHCRVFLRCLSPRALLYTEMVTAAAIAHGDTQRLLGFDAREQPVALQLGGSDPQQLAAAARIGADFGYSEINLNCGCPSDKVSIGAFGACLMEQPAVVAECVAAMRAVVQIPVTVKMRIGVINRHRDRDIDARAAVNRFDEADFAALQQFTAAIVEAGCQGVIVHARKAILGGLSPADNRSVPPLRFDVVQRLRGCFPQLPFAVNGGVQSAEAALQALQWCDSVMIGREAYHRPYVLADLQQVCYPQEPVLRPSPQQVLQQMRTYAEQQLRQGTRLSAITRHMLGLVSHVPGARDYRRLLSEGAREAGADAALLSRAEALLVTAAVAGSISQSTGDSSSKGLFSIEA
jgi:tRNA-dihydrouridine synthase A